MALVANALGVPTHHQEQKDEDLHHMELEEMNDDKKEMVETSDEEDIEDDDEVNEILSHVFCDSEQESD